MRPTATVLAFLLMALSPLAAGQDDAISHTFTARSGGELATDVELDPGQLLVIEANVTVPARQNTSWQVFLFGHVGGERFSSEPVRAFANASGGVMVAATNAVVPLDAEPGSNVTLAYNASVQSLSLTDPNATWLEEASIEGSLVLTIAVPPEPPRTPIALYIGAGVIIGVGLAVIALAKRKPRQVKSEPRSRAMQELEAESKKKRRGDAEAEQAEPSLPPQLTILEARAADVRRMVELARQRMDRGELTEHQFNTIRERKEAELQEIEEEMEQLRATGDVS